jgi:hypothetical protein
MAAGNATTRSSYKSALKSWKRFLAATKLPIRHTVPPATWHLFAEFLSRYKYKTARSYLSAVRSELLLQGITAPQNDTIVKRILCDLKNNPDKTPRKKVVCPPTNCTRCRSIASTHATTGYGP